MLEPSILEMTGDAALQFERQGYFVKDADSTADKPVFNRTIGLRDSWAKEQKRR
jgi:glutaminyl-tRNA synthetase